MLMILGIPVKKLHISENMNVDNGKRKVPISRNIRCRSIDIKIIKTQHKVSRLSKEKQNQKDVAFGY